MRKSWAPAALLPLIALVAGLAATPAAADRSGSSPLRIELDTNIDYVDPALAYYVYSWQLENATCAKLVRYPDLSPPAGSLLQPEIAAGMPTVSADGRTYTFQIRNDYFFSPPATGVVTAASMKYTFERTLHPSSGLAVSVLLLRHRRRAGVHQRHSADDHRNRGQRKHVEHHADPACRRLPSAACAAVCVCRADFSPHQPGRRAGARSFGRAVLHLVLDVWERRCRHGESQPELHRPAATALRLDPVRVRPAARDDPPADRGGDDRLRAGPGGRTSGARPAVWPRQRGRRRGEPAVVRNRVPPLFAT